MRDNVHNIRLKKEGDRNVVQLSNLDHVTTNAHYYQGKAQLYILEENGSVIKMIMKGRSPMMRHVSRTHRAALDGSCDRINLDPKIQIKYVDTKNQLADLLTKGCFTRDEWCTLLLRPFNIMNLSMFSRSHFRSVKKANPMSERMQDKKTGEELAEAKPRPTSLVSKKTIERETNSLP